LGRLSRNNKPDLTLAVILFIIIVFAFSCNPTKYVPQGDSLLDENKISVNTERVRKENLEPYIRQKPNKTIFGTKFHLGLYNLSNIEKTKWPNKWLRDIGEEPVIFDPDAAAKSKEQIKSYLSSKGYFDGQVMETIETANRKTKVFYDVDLKTPYTINKIYYDVADSIISMIGFADSTNILIAKGMPYDEEILQAERARLERSVRDHGFYNFSADYVSFRVDSMAGERQVNIYYSVRNFLRPGFGNVPVQVPHIQYKVHNIYIYPDYIPGNFLSGGEDYLKSFDTLSYKGYYFITNTKKPSVKYDIIIQSLYIKPGVTFNLSNSERSHTHLMSLRTYRLVNILYNDRSDMSEDGKEKNSLDCVIQLTPMSRQSYSVELEGTNSGGNLGGALNFIYQNKNLLRGAEQFNMKLTGAYETFSRDSSGSRGNTQQYGFETALRLPRFLVPFLESENFIKKYNPTTSIIAAYNYQNLPVYTRTVANATFGYMWNDGPYRTHIINPLQMNMVKIPFIDEDYYNNVIATSTYLINSYKDVLIAGINYSYIYTNQKIKKSRDYWFLRINAETAGNLLRAVKNLTNAQLYTDSLSSYYTLFGQPFAQFIRADIDLRYNRIINDVSSVVYRTFVGVGFPYKNSVAMPFEKQYYEGGANGIRGWQVRSLGPGSYYPPSSTYTNQTADIKIEANIEYRFKLFWILEGAMFVDAGNIWAIKEDPSRPGAQFKFGKLLDDLAIGTGVGMRFDLNFVTLRTDIGFKLRDPKYTGDSKWLVNRDFSNKDLAMVISIGYPF
jgi:outer membrane protein assembly factor BamA